MHLVVMIFEALPILNPLELTAKKSERVRGNSGDKVPADEVLTNRGKNGPNGGV